MKAYSEYEIFTLDELNTRKEAQRLVDAIPTTFGYEVRCHELTRVVSRFLVLPVMDGMFGVVEHSWLLIPRKDGKPVPAPILDVYIPGVSPQVLLVDSSPLLPFARMYRPGQIRTDIRESLIDELCLVIRNNS